MSKVSKWLGPPHWNRKMTDLALAAGLSNWLSKARAQRGMVRPNMPKPPARKMLRRDIRVEWKLEQDRDMLLEQRR